MLDSQDFKSTFSDKGFTLIEILVALTLMSLMMISIYNVVDNNIDTKDKVTEEDREFLQVYLAIDRIERDLSMMFTPLFYDTLPKAAGAEANGESVNPSANTPSSTSRPINDFFPQVSERGHIVPLFQLIDKGEIAFFSSSHRRFVEGQKESNFQWVRYTFDSAEDGDAEGTSRLYRQTVTQNIYDPAMDLDKARSFLLLKGVKSLIFEYWEPERARWVESYDFQKNRPPLSIRVTLQWLSKEREEEEPEVFTRVIRPYFPQFDPSQDLQQSQTPNGRPTGANPSSPAGNNI